MKKNFRLTFKHKGFCSDYLETGNATQSYLKHFATENTNTAKVNAFKLLQKASIKQYLIELQELNKEVSDAAKTRVIEELKDRIISTTEIDFFHTQVLRGEIMVEEVYPVREYIPIKRDDKGEVLIGTGKWVISFKKITRLPNIREKQISAMELYRRTGAYAPTKFQGEIDDSREPSDKPKTDYVILSDGSKIPFNG